MSSNPFLNNENKEQHFASGPPLGVPLDNTVLSSSEWASSTLNALDKPKQNNDKSILNPTSAPITTTTTTQVVDVPAEAPTTTVQPPSSHPTTGFAVHEGPTTQAVPGAFPSYSENDSVNLDTAKSLAASALSTVASTATSLAQSAYANAPSAETIQDVAGRAAGTVAGYTLMAGQKVREVAPERETVQQVAGDGLGTAKEYVAPAAGAATEYVGSAAGTAKEYVGAAGGKVASYLPGTSSESPSAVLSSIADSVKVQPTDDKNEHVKAQWKTSGIPDTPIADSEIAPLDSSSPEHAWRTTPASSLTNTGVIKLNSDSALGSNTNDMTAMLAASGVSTGVVGPGSGGSGFNTVKNDTSATTGLRDMPIEETKIAPLDSEPAPTKNAMTGAGSANTGTTKLTAPLGAAAFTAPLPTPPTTTTVPPTATSNIAPPPLPAADALPPSTHAVAPTTTPIRAPIGSGGDTSAGMGISHPVTAAALASSKHHEVPSTGVNTDKALPSTPHHHHHQHQQSTAAPITTSSTHSHLNNISNDTSNDTPASDTNINKNNSTSYTDTNASNDDETSHSTTHPRDKPTSKPSILTKIKGEMKVLSGKIENKDEKVEQGKKMMGKN